MTQTALVGRRVSAYAWGVDVRGQIVTLAHEAVADNSQWRYDEVRPIPLHAPAGSVITTDCSGAVDLLYFRGGAQDPFGLGYDGEGWSEDLFNHGAHIPLRDVLPADVAVFGPSGTVHAALFVTPGTSATPACFSHGQPGDPHIVPLATLEGLGIATFLRFSTLGREPEPAATLVQRRGFVLLQDPIDEATAIRNGWNVWRWTGWQFVVDNAPAALPAERWADYRWPEKRPK